MTPFDRLVADLATEQQQIETRAVLAKALDAQRAGRLSAHVVALLEALANRGQPIAKMFNKATAVDAIHDHREAEHDASDEKIARSKLDYLIEEAQRAGRLRPGDAARAEAAANLGKPIPRDVLARILGRLA